MRDFWQYLLWATFGNDDDGIYGDLSFNPTQEKTWQIAVLWWLRNPLHNAVYYVLGTGYMRTVRTGLYPDDVFSPVGGWNYAVTRVHRYSLWYSGALGLLFGVLITSPAVAACWAWWNFLVQPFSLWWLLASWPPLLPVAAWFIYGWAGALRIYGVMPFVSYIGAIKTYLGWRERGNFGMKLTNNGSK